VVTEAVEVEGVVVVVDDFDSDGSCRSGGVFSCGEENGNIAGIVVKRVVAVVVVTFEGSIVVMPVDG